MLIAWAAIFAGSAESQQTAPPTHFARLIPSPEPGWPQWRGPRRDGISTETNLLSTWPEGGPHLLWKAEGLGYGYAAPIIVRDRIFLAGDAGPDLVVHALDLEGKAVWKATNGASWNGPYPGARAACAYADGSILHLNAHGRLACLDASTGRERWHVNILERFGGRNITWALSECLLVDGPRVMVTAGGERALMAALDLKNGRTLWTTPALLEAKMPGDSNPGEAATERAGYSSPVLFEMAGRRHLVNLSQTHGFGVDADTGKLLWSQPLPTRYKVLACTPAVYQDSVFLTGPDGRNIGLYRITAIGEDVSVAPRWPAKLDTCHGGVIVMGERLYGSWYRGRKGWACLDANTGEVIYQTSELTKGSALWADGRLYVLTEDGVMALVKPGPDAFEIVSRFPFAPKHKNDVWAHPVLLNGRLYLRQHQALFCYEVGKK